MQQQELKDLLQRYMDDQLSPGEKAVFIQLLEKHRLTTDWESLVEELADAYPAAAFMRPEWDPFVQSVIDTGKERERPHRRISRYWAAAAAILLLGTGIYFWAAKQKEKPATAGMIPGKTIKPGRNGAILTLADGSKVAVDSLDGGVVATQNGTQVILQNGQLTYDAGKAAAGAPVQYNTMTTPKGRQFSLQLPDGTRVWLNAASSIRYPTTFTGNSRTVEVTGEAYFDVAKLAAMPFRVHIKDRVEVLVLGTQFNVNAYGDRQTVNTTLIEGSVAVQGTKLKPGQQAQVPLDGSNDIKVVEIAQEKVTAWKNGLFNFEGMRLQDAMRQLERWYDITVEYEHGIPDIQFFGEIDRNANLEDLLQILSGAKLKFRIEGNKLVVIK